MPWNNQGGGGGWQGPGGGGGGPWGRGPVGGGGGQPPDLEQLIKRVQDRGRQFLPGGFGGGRGILIVVFALIAVWGLTGFYTVSPDEQGVPLVFGKWSGTTTAEGLNYNWPAPIGQVYTPKVTRIERTEVGFRSDAVSSNATHDVPDEGLMLTGDENIIDVQFTVFWRIKRSRPVPVQHPRPADRGAGRRRERDAPGDRPDARWRRRWPRAAARSSRTPSP